jgi:hypothetical protein
MTRPFPEMYEQIGDDRPDDGRQLSVIVVGCAVLVVGLMIWWVWAVVAP